MAYSMTGLGLGEASINGINIKIELRSVNNRFLEISCRMPSSAVEYEQQLREMIRERIDRGKIYVQITIQGENTDGPQLKVNRQSVRFIKNLLEDIADEAGLEKDISLEDYLKFSEIFEPAESRNDNSSLLEALKGSLSAAIENLIEMRSKEGKALTDDISERLQRLTENLSDIESAAASNSQQILQRLREKIEKLVSSRELNEDRLYLEAALLAEKSDITEECVRLHSHCGLFLRTMEDEAIVGKKLNFLLQEMNREVNTISSKALSSEISHLAVNMKGEIEKIREQVQNLE
jgi:uncharacterized protein (TIGR00255 family)